METLEQYISRGGVIKKIKAVVPRQIRNPGRWTYKVKDLCMDNIIQGERDRASKMPWCRKKKASK